MQLYRDGLFEGEVVVITGGGRGIGRAAVLDFARLGAERIVLAVRSPAAPYVTATLDAAAAAAVAAGHHPPHMAALRLDLASLDSVRAFPAALAAEMRTREPAIHVLVNNAGAMGLGPDLVMPHDPAACGEPGCTLIGVDLTLATNHMGHFALTHALLPALERAAAASPPSDPARIVNVTSVTHNMVSAWPADYIAGHNVAATNSMFRYAASKLANVVYTHALATRLDSSCITVNACHPGNVITDVTANYFGPFIRVVTPIATSLAWILYALGLNWSIRPLAKGSEALVYLVAAPHLRFVSGAYFNISRLTEASRLSYDAAAAEDLWRVSEHITCAKYPVHM